jgi:endonuclease/exonuclease/phosphatase family metal-dependent hydrolase
MIKNLILSFTFLASFVTGYSQENTIRLMSYNIRNAVGMDNKVDYRRVANVITEIAPDVIALQELDSVTNRSHKTDVLLRLAELTKMHPVYGASIPFDGGKYGVGVLSKTKPLSWHRIALPGREEARSLLLVEFADYVFCSTHFSLNEDDRLASVSLIDQAAKTYHKPVFLAGDINATPDSPVLKAFRKNWKLLSDTAQLTFPSDKPDCTIDYLFGYNPGGFSYSVKQARVLNGKNASDHLPLFADVSPKTLATADGQTNYRTVEGISYRNSDDAYSKERCVLDVYYPENKKGFATVVWFHGGGLEGGNKFIPDELKNCGLAVVAVNYRFLPKVTIGECVDDATFAIAWTLKEIEKYGGDPRKIFISGHSAGGYLVSLVGLNKKLLAPHNLDANSIAAIIPFSGQAISHYNYRKMLGIAETQPIIDEFAPLYHVRADAPPLVIISGDRNMELLGRYEENAYFWRMMQVTGHKETYLYELDGYDHGAMANPAFHILKNHIKQILNKK